MDVLTLHGLDRFEARKSIVAKLEELGLLEKIEPHVHQVPHGDRSDVVIEPWLTEQWYVNAAELAKPAIAAVENGRHRLRPEELGEDLFRMDAQHPALVHLAPAVVGASDSGVVRAGRHRSSSKRRRTSPCAAAERHYGTRVMLDARRRRARHLVLLGALAVLDAGLAR